MPDKIVIDASVVAKWFSNEALTDKALKIRDNFDDGIISLVAPNHILYEVGNAIWKNKILDTNDCISAMHSLMNSGIELVQPDTNFVSRTMKLARQLAISYYDALYVQLSIDYGIPLLSVDEKLVTKAKKAANTIHLRDF